MRFNRRDFLSSMTGLAGLAVFPVHAENAVSTYRRVFAQPPAQAKPWVRWWWPGGAVTDDELRREIEVLSRAGFGGAEIQPFNPVIPNLTKEERTRLNDYANATFFAHVNACTDEAQRHGMQIDSTFGSAWPSGGGFAITPELALIELTPKLTSVRAPLAGPIHVNVPAQTRKFGTISPLDARAKDPRVQDWPARLAARQKVVAVVAFKGQAPLLEKNTNYRSAVVKASGRMASPAGIVVTDKLGADGVLDWTPPGDGEWQIAVFKQFAVDSSVMTGVGEGPQLVLDHFKRAAFDAHARRVGDPLAQEGKPARALRATFVDSLELMPDIYWSEDLLDQFRARRGYDLTPYLPHLLQPGWMESWNAHTSPPYFDAGDTGDRIRADYRLTVSELMIENYWRPFISWNHAHGLQARVQAHGGPTDLLQSYGLADIPETEDLEARGDTHFMRVARAAANLYGRKLVSCESLCWPGRSYEVTPAEWLARVNLLFASGVNAIVMHGFPYALHTEKWPGWYPFAPSAFLTGFSSMINEANPLWDAFGSLNGYISRVQGIMQGARNVVNVAVYFGEIGYFHGMEPPATNELLESLLADGFDYDRINDDSLLKSRVVAKRLVTPGGARYAALVLPPRAGLRLATARHLAKLAGDGLPIFFADRPPYRDEGYFDPERQDQLVRQAVQAMLGASARTVATKGVPAALRQAGIPANLTFTSRPCLFVEKSLDGATFYFLHNPEAEAMNVSFLTRATGYPELWNAFDGSHTGIHAMPGHGQTEVSVEIAAGGAALIVFGAQRALSQASWVVVDAIELTQYRWTLGVEGHGRGGRPLQRRLTLDRLVDWSAIDGLADLSGRAAYDIEVALPEHWIQKGHQVWLELGAAHDMARISVNGKPAATLLAAPFSADLTDALQPGSNRLTITVSNSPNNAMMDPKLPGLKDLKPKAAGLLGPVKLVLKNRKVTP